MSRQMNPGVPLTHYRQHGAGVRLTCLTCMNCRDLPLEPVIACLEARGVGDAWTGTRPVAAFATAPCPRCGAHRFEAAPCSPTSAKRAAGRPAASRMQGADRSSNPAGFWLT